MEHHAIMPGVILLYQRDNKILLGKRQNTGFYDGYYTPVSGHVEAGELFVDAMIREAAEEAGLQLQHNELQHIHTQQWRGKEERLGIRFILTTQHHQPVNKEPEECEDFFRFPVDNVPENCIPFFAHGRKAIQEGKSYSHMGY